MKDNIFEDAYFGKPYKTRKGEKLFFQRIFDYQGCAQLVSETRYLTYDLDGFVSTFRHTVPEDEIIGEWEEEINEKELDKLATEYEGHINWEYNPDYAVYSNEQLINAYKAGYRKAMKYLIK